MMRLFHMVMFYTNCRITTGIFITSLPKQPATDPQQLQSFVPGLWI